MPIAGVCKLESAWADSQQGSRDYSLAPLKLTQLGANVQRTLQFGCINVRQLWHVHRTFV